MIVPSATRTQSPTATSGTSSVEARRRRPSLSMTARSVGDCDHLRGEVEAHRQRLPAHDARRDAHHCLLDCHHELAHALAYWHRTTSRPKPKSAAPMPTNRPSTGASRQLAAMPITWAIGSAWLLVRRRPCATGRAARQSQRHDLAGGTPTAASTITTGVPPGRRADGRRRAGRSGARRRRAARRSRLGSRCAAAQSATPSSRRSARAAHRAADRDRVASVVIIAVRPPPAGRGSAWRTRCTGRSAHELLEAVRRLGLRQCQHRRRKARQVGLDGGLVLARRRHDLSRGDLALLVDVVVVEEQAARRLGRPAGRARARGPRPCGRARAAE